MPDNNIKFSITFPDGHSEQWGQQDYEQYQDRLYTDHPDAKVARVTTYMEKDDSDPLASDSFHIAFPDGHSEDWSREDFNRFRSRLNEDHPDAKIFKVSDMAQRYWEPKRDEAKRNLEAFEAAHGDFVRKYENDEDMAVMLEGENVLNSPQQDFVEKNRGKYKDLARQREELRQAYYSNPLVAREYKNAAENAGRLHDEYIKKAEEAETGEERRDWKRAAKLQEDMQKLYNAPQKYTAETDERNGFLKRYAAGAGDVFTDKDFWTRGITEIARNVDIRRAAKKMEEAANAKDGDLTADDIDRILSPGEKAELQSFFQLAKAQQERADDVSGAYKAGSSFADSLGFMAEFMLSSGLGNLAGKALSSSSKGFAQWLGRELMSERALTRAIEKGVTTAAKGSKAALLADEYAVKPIIQGLWHTGTQIGTLATISDGLMETDDNGKLISVGKAIRKGVLDSIVENWSESFGGAIEKTLSLPFQGIGYIGEKTLGGTSFGRFARWLYNSAPTQLMKEAGFNGMLGEIGEEWAGNAVRVGLGLMTPDEFKSFASWEQQLEMAASFAPLSLFGLGTSSIAAIKKSKNYKRLSGEVQQILAKQGVPTEEIDDLFNTRFDTAEDVGKKLAPYLRNISATKDDNPEAEKDYRTMLDFAKELGLQKVADEMDRLEQEDLRTTMRENIESKIGQPFWMDHDSPEAKEKDGTPVKIQEVHFIRYNDGHVEYVVGQDEEGNYATVDEQGRHGFTSKEKIASGIEDGSIVEDQEVMLDDYLQERVDAERESREQARMSEERKTQVTEVMRDVAANPNIIRLGTDEAPIQTTVVGINENGVVVAYEEDGVAKQQPMTWNEVANHIGKPITVMTDEEVVAWEAESLDAARRRLEGYKKVTPGTEMKVILPTAEGEEEVSYQFQNAVIDDGQIMFYGLDENGNSVQVTEDMVSNRDGLLASLEAKDVTDALDNESEVVNEVDDGKLRDIHGNEIPMMDGEVDVDTFFKNDAEAWAAWNDEDRKDGGADSVETISNTLSGIQKNIKKLEKERSGLSAPGARREKEKQINALSEKAAYYQSILDKYAARAEAAKEAAAAAERRRQRELNAPKTIEELASRVLAAQDKGTLNYDDFQRETGKSDEEMKQLFPFWAKRGTGKTVAGLAEEMAREDEFGLVPMDSNADQKDTKVAKDAILAVLQESATPSDIANYTQRANLAREKQEQDYYENAPEAVQEETEVASEATGQPATEAGGEPESGQQTPAPVHGEVEGDGGRVNSSEDESAANSEATPIGRNRFGNIYQWAVGKIKEAADFLSSLKEGYLKGVFSRDGFGFVDMIWGNEKAGLNHIIEEHIKKADDFNSLEEALSIIDDVIKNGVETRQGTNVSFDKDGYRVSVAQSEEGNWLLTAFDTTRKREDKKRNKGGSTIGDQETSDAENGTLVSPQLDSKSKDNEKSENTSTPGEKSAVQGTIDFEAAPEEKPAESQSVPEKEEKPVEAAPVAKKTVTTFHPDNLRKAYESGEKSDIAKAEKAMANYINSSDSIVLLKGTERSAKNRKRSAKEGSAEYKTQDFIIKAISKRLKELNKSLPKVNGMSAVDAFKDARETYDNRWNASEEALKRAIAYYEQERKLAQDALDALGDEAKGDTTGDLYANGLKGRISSANTMLNGLQMELSRFAEESEAETEQPAEQPEQLTESQKKAIGFVEGKTPEEVEAETKRAAFEKRSEKWKKLLGDVFVVLNSEEEVMQMEESDDFKKSAIDAVRDPKAKARGWYSPVTGKAYIYMPNIGSVDEFDRKVLHEVIAHKGIRGLFKSEVAFNSFLDKVWNEFMSEKWQKEFIDYVGGNADNASSRRAAADEFVAHWAEGNESILKTLDENTWSKIVEALKRILNDMIGEDFFQTGVRTTPFDEELRGALNEFILARREAEQKERAAQEARMDVAEGMAGGESKAVDTMKAEKNPQVPISKTKEKYDDFGEKIGMARKDTALPGRKKGDGDSRPSWMKKYKTINVKMLSEDERRIMEALGSRKGFQEVIGDITKGTDFSQPFVGFYEEEIKSRFGNRVRTHYILDENRKPVIFTSREQFEATMPVFEAKDQGYRVVESDGKFKIIRPASNGKRVEYAEFDTKEEAVAYLASPEGCTDILNRKRENYGLPALERLTRNGMPDYRNGKDATPDDFLNVFGFRGGEFGNWLNADEQQQALNYAYDALMDLAKALGISPRAISLGGELSIAFGARGEGGSGAAAHYEATRAVINLTKMKGAGSLAHEWAHAMDNYFGLMAAKKTRDRDKENANQEFLSEGVFPSSGVRKEVKDAFNEVMSALKKKKVTRKIEIDQAQAEYDDMAKYFHRQIQNYRREFERGVTKYPYNRKTKKREEVHVAPTEEQLKEYDRLTALLENDPTFKLGWHYEKMAWRAEGEVAEKLYDLVKDVFSDKAKTTGPLHNVFYYLDKMQPLRQRLERAKAGEEETVTTETDFVRESRWFDRDRAGAYWTKDLEMFARAFETYLSAKMRENGQSSDYLTYMKGPLYRSMWDHSPYPEGEELTVAMKAFDKLFQTIQEKTDEDTGKTLLFDKGDVDIFSEPITEEKTGSVFTNDNERVNYVSDGSLPVGSGVNSLVERTYRKSGAFSFTGKNKIESAGDVAYIFKELETSATENSFIVFVKDGKPTILHTGIGTIDRTEIDTAPMVVGLKDFAPDKIYMVHNHPSGSVVASTADGKMLDRLQMMAGDIPVEGIIIDTVSGEYGVFDKELGSTLIDNRRGEDAQAVPLEVLTFDKMVFSPEYRSEIGRGVNGAKDVAAYLSAHRLGDGQKVGALLLNKHNQVVGNLVLNDNVLNADNAETAANDVVDAAVRSAASGVVLFGDMSADKMTLYRFRNSIYRISGDSVRWLDAVKVEGNYTRSLMEGVLLNDAEEDAVVAENLRFSKVTDPKLLEELNNGKTFKAYRAMAFIEDENGDVEADLGDGRGMRKGRLYSPMATQERDEKGRWTLRQATEIGAWEQSDEHPEKAKLKKGKWVFTLKKPDGTTVDAAYNPYIHTSLIPLNDQFTSAHRRPELVTVEVEVPESELTSGYKADKAKDAVGKMPWHSGPVAGQLPEGMKREVVLTRYAKPVRVVPNGEVAETIVNQFEGVENPVFPWNVFTPALRNELEKRGVTFSDEAAGTVSEEDQKKYKESKAFKNAQTEQKVPGKEYIGEEDLVDIRFSLSRNNRATIEAWMKKRSDLSDEQRKNVIGYIETLDNPTLQLATAKWFTQGVVRLPEDMQKIEQAVDVAGKAKVDPLRYGSPMELLEANTDFKPTEKRINPDEVPTLHRAKEYDEHGIVIYDVDESEESRQNMRQIINTHFGKDASPWCLLQGDGEGNLTKDSKDYWKHYNAYPKQVAFKDGKLFAFSANDSDRRVWWDRQDAAHGGLPLDLPIKDDSLGRTGTYEYNPETGKLSGPSNVRRGNKNNGTYEEWNDADVLVTRMHYKNGKLDGLQERFYAGGEPMLREETKDGLTVGKYTTWYASGQLHHDHSFNKNGLAEGEQREYFSDGSLAYRCNYINGKKEGVEERFNVTTGKPMARYHYNGGRRDGMSETWNDKGQLQTQIEYKDGERDGISRIYHWNGKLARESTYKNDVITGESKTWYESGNLNRVQHFDEKGAMHGPQEGYYDFAGREQIAERIDYNHGVIDGLYEKWHDEGQLKSRDHYKDGKKNGLSEAWFDNGVLARRETYKDGLSDGIKEHWDSGGKLWSRTLMEDGREVRFLGTLPNESVYDGAKIDEIRLSKAYHGTDAVFDRFDLSYAGSGEGVWAHGYGHYFSMNENIGRKYAYKMGGTDEEIDRAIGAVSGEIVRNQIRLRNAKNDMERRYYENAIAASERRIEQLRSGERNLYTVDIPEDTGENYIDEMKTLAKPLRRRIADVVRNIPEEKLARSMHGPSWLPQGFQTLANIIEREQYAGLEIRNRLEDALGNTIKAKKETSKILHDAGFVGMKYNGGVDGPCVVIFDDNDVEITDHIRFSKSNQTQNGFVSNAEMAVESIPMQKATPEQWAKMIEKNGGMKAGEDKWLGLSDWLKSQDKKTITKEEILDYINENRIQIEEKHYYEPGVMESEWDQQHPGFTTAYFIEVNDFSNEPYIDGVNDLEEAVRLYNESHEEKIEPGAVISDEDYEKLLNYGEKLLKESSGNSINQVRLDYTTEGLTNRHEIALTVPTIEPWNENDKIHFGDAGEGRAVAWIRFGDAIAAADEKKVEEAKRKHILAENAFNKLVRELKSKYDVQLYGDLLGVVSKEERAELRKLGDESGSTLNELEDIVSAGSGKVLVIDEIQSKRHQEARESGGYKDAEMEKKAKRHNELSRKFYSEEGLTFDEHKEFRALQDEMPMSIEVERNKKRPEPAPFEKNWHELAMKRMLRYAAENGYDKVAWTTGEQQAQRYDIGQVVEDVEKNDGKIYIDLKDGSAITLTTDSEGKITSSTGAHIESGAYNGKNLSELIGKEMAVKVLSSEEDQVFRGESLRVGGEGMKGFYDEILPRFMNKYGKKWGVKVQDVFLPEIGDDAAAGAANGLTMHSVDVTPEMVESVMQGQLMFSKNNSAVERVSREGIGAVVGKDNVRDFYMNIYRAIPKELRKKYVDMAWSGLNFTQAIESDLRRIIRDGIENDKDGLYDLAATMLKDLSEEELSPEAVKYILWRGQKGVDQADMLSLVEDISQKNRLDLLKKYESVSEKEKEFDRAIRETFYIPSGYKYFFVTNDKIREVLSKKGLPKERIENAVVDAKNGVQGTYFEEIKETVFFIDNIKSVEELKLFFPHERQHDKTMRDGHPHTQEIIDSYGWRDDKDNAKGRMREVVAKLSNSRNYDEADEIDLANEIMSYGVQQAFLDENFADTLKNKYLVPENIVELIKNEYGYWRNVDSVFDSSSERGSRDDNTDERGGYDDGGNQARESGVLQESRVGTDSGNAQANEGEEGEEVKSPLFSKGELEESLDTNRDALANAADNAKSWLDEWKKVYRDENLLTVAKAMSLQKEYDRKTVSAITELAKALLKDQTIDALNRREVSRLLGIVKTSVGKSPATVKKNADILVGMVIDHLLKREEEGLDRIMKTRATKENATGVNVQGELDLRGQNVMAAFKAGLDMPIESDKDDVLTIDNRLVELSDLMESKDDAVRSEAEDEFAGLSLAREYQENIKSSKNEEREIRSEMKDAANDVKDGKMTRRDYAQFIKEEEDAIRKNQIERIDAYRELRAKLQGVIAGSKDAMKEFREREKQRIADIRHLANSDMEGRSASPDEKLGFAGQLANSSLVRFLASPLGTFDQMLRLFGEKSISGEGYLWNKFMRGWIDATENAFTGQKEAKSILDKKASEVFGREMKWSDIYDEVRKMPKVKVQWWDDGKMTDHELTQGNLLYIYMVNKMADGRMKLRRMGISEEDVAAIKRQMDPRFLELADWLQGEYLVNLRNKYNAVHERLFGASMAAIEDYFPLKINKRSLNKAEDIGNQYDGESLPATTTGSIIKRRRNSQNLDLLNADAFSVVIEHVDQMEQWAAFAEFNKDLNTLLSYKRFRNQVQNMSSVYGSGAKLWSNFKDVARIAGGTYHPAVKAESLDSAAVNLAKGVTSAKISFRVYTAIKQLLSFPAFVADANVGYLAKNLATPWKSWSWAMENLPVFEKRWKSRIAGDTRLMNTESDWKFFRSKVYEKLSRLGMTPNAFIDAVTVSVGAHAMYQTKYEQYIKEGYDEETADKKAKQDATILYNETQQSSEGAFLSTAQLDRTVMSTMITVFRNSSMGYQRQLHDAVRNLGKRMKKGYKEESIAFMKKQMMRDGLTEEQAEHAAERRYNRAFMHDTVRVATFGFIVQFAWNLGASLAYLLFGDDDDKKVDMLSEALVHALLGGWNEGLSGGNVISDAMNMVAKGEKLQNYDPTLLPLISDLKRMARMYGYDKVAASNELLNIALQAFTGVNPQTFEDMIVAVIDACGGDMDTSKEAMLLMMRVMQVPQSQLDEIYIDELGTNARGARRMSPSRMAERYARYKVARGAGKLGWAYSDELEEKREKSYLKSFNKKVKARKENKKKK